MVWKRIGGELHTGAALALLCVASCIPAEQQADVGRPPGETDLAVSAEADNPQVVEDSAVTLSAAATGGTPPYLYRWNQNDGPVDLDMSDVEMTADTLTTPVLADVGRYVFRVVGTDQQGFTEAAYVAVEAMAALSAEIEVADEQLYEGMAATLHAKTQQGTTPLTFAWELTDGPVDVDLTEADSADLTTSPLTTVGDYTIQVTVEDSAGYTATDEVTFSVLSAVTVSVPELAIANEPTELTVTVETPTEGLTFLWKVTNGSASFDDDTAPDPMLTTTADETVELRLTVTIPTDDGSTVDMTRESQIVSIVGEAPRVLIETSLGAVTLELDRVATPLHAANFLYYVDSGFYDEIVFHRACSPTNADLGTCGPAMIQTGAYKRVDGEFEPQEPTRDAVPSEAAEGQTAFAKYDVALALNALYTGTGPDP
ncbi:MAG: peptidylprolyl isomerase, partial [Planctomycetes bacterium]|nr:peptidylprolyl isomerase [Planctomycetota bacterium]